MTATTLTGHQVSDRKDASLHSTDGCHYSGRPAIGDPIPLTEANSARHCGLIGCRKARERAAVEVEIAANNTTASNARRYAREDALIDRAESLMAPADRAALNARRAQAAAMITADWLGDDSRPLDLARTTADDLFALLHRPAA